MKLILLDTDKIEGLEIEDGLNTPINSRSRASRLSSLLSGDSLAYSVLTFGDFLYDLIRVNPTIMEAADFARSADLEDLPSFIRFSQEVVSRPFSQFQGDISQIQGYVAEHMVAHSLRAQGAEVYFPESANQAGYDLIVNGHFFQVKNLASPDGVYEHLSKYPNIPVLVNEELATTFEADDRVFPIIGLKHQEIVDSTKETISAASEVLDIEIPIISSTIIVARNSYALFKEKTDPKTALENAALDISTRSTGGVAGAFASSGLLWGIGLSSGWGSIIFPIFGAIAGHEVGKRIGNRIKIEILCKEEKEALQSAIINYLKAASLVLRNMIDTAKDKLSSLSFDFTDDLVIKKAITGNWQKRLIEEIEFRELMLSKINWGIQNNGKMADCEDSVLASSIESLSAAKRAGILSANLPSEYRMLIERIQKFREELDKRLI